MLDVSEEVEALTGNKQKPNLDISKRPRGCLAANCNAAPAIDPNPRPLGEAAQAWAAAKDTTSTVVLEAFVRSYPDSFFATLARERIVELKAQALGFNVSRPTIPAARTLRRATLSSRAAKPLSAAEECALKPKDVFKECETCPEWWECLRASLRWARRRGRRDVTRSRVRSTRSRFRSRLRWGGFQ